MYHFGNKKWLTLRLCVFILYIVCSVFEAGCKTSRQPYSLPYPEPYSAFHHGEGGAMVKSALILLGIPPFYAHGPQIRGIPLRCASAQSESCENGSGTRETRLLEAARSNFPIRCGVMYTKLRSGFKAKALRQAAAQRGLVRQIPLDAVILQQKSRPLRNGL